MNFENSFSFMTLIMHVFMPLKNNVIYITNVIKIQPFSFLMAFLEYLVVH